MNPRIYLFTTVLAATVLSAPAAAQHQGHQPPQATQATPCSQAQASVTAAIDASIKRLEDARQTNSAAAMRAATADVQAALLQMRAQLAPCAQMQPVVPGQPGAPAHPGAQTQPDTPAPAPAPGHVH